MEAGLQSLSEDLNGFVSTEDFIDNWVHCFWAAGSFTRYKLSPTKVSLHTGNSPRIQVPSVARLQCIFYVFEMTQLSCSTGWVQLSTSMLYPLVASKSNDVYNLCNMLDDKAGAMQTLEKQKTMMWVLIHSLFHPSWRNLKCLNEDKLRSLTNYGTNDCKHKLGAESFGWPDHYKLTTPCRRNGFNLVFPQKLQDLAQLSTTTEFACRWSDTWAVYIIHPLTA